MHYFHYVLVSGSHFLCLGVACGVQGLGSSGDAAMLLFVRNAWLDSGYMFHVSSGRFFGRIAHIFFGKVDSDPEVSRSPRCCRMEKCAQPMLQFAVPLCSARNWKSEHFFYEVDEPGSKCDDGWDGGVAGSLDSYVTCHQLVSVTRASLLSFVAIHIAHLNPSPKQQQQQHVDIHIDLRQPASETTTHNNTQPQRQRQRHTTNDDDD